jgi:hypothetical protein
MGQLHSTRTAPHRGGVVHGVVVRHQLVVEHRGAVGVGLADEVVAHDDDGHAGGADVLLHAAVDDAVPLDVDGLGQVVGGHVRHQRHVAGVGDVLRGRATTT